MKFIWKQNRIDLYIAAVIVPSVVLAAVALWALVRQYNFINYRLRMQDTLALSEGELFGAFSRVSIFAFSMIILALLVILIIGSFLSAQDMQRKLEVAKLKNDFVSNVSHELKTPLTSIRLLAERLPKVSPQGGGAKQKEYLDLILGQSYKLGHLISNVLDFSQLEQGGEENYQFEKADLRELIHHSILDYPAELIYPDRKLETSNIADDLPLFYLDRMAISRAFINLLDNALKFSPPGGRVKISSGKIGNEAFIEVADQGPGIDEKEKGKVFERFYHRGKGTGIGLTLVRHIVEGHHGRVELESEKDKGSKFRIILPIKDKS